VLFKLANLLVQTGIVGDERDLERRKIIFGKNSKPLPQLPTIFESIKQTAQDKLWWCVGGAAVFSALSGGIFLGFAGLVEGFSIVLAALLIISITSLADWIKDKQFVALQSLIKEEEVTVIRGKFGATSSISVWDLVVGDVILLDTGARVPADCLIVESSDL